LLFDLENELNPAIFKDFTFFVNSLVEPVCPVLIWQESNYQQPDYPHHTSPTTLKNAQYNGLSDLHHYNNLENRYKIKQKINATALPNSRFLPILHQI